MQLIGAGAIVLIVSVFVAFWHLHHDRDVWSPDGAIYLRMTLQDRGVPADLAQKEVDRFMLAVLARGRTSRADSSLFLERTPSFYVEQVRMFASRPLYPLLCGFLYPAFGAMALKIVSAVAYVLTVVAMFAFLLLITSTVKAALGALLLGTEQVVLNFLAMPLTDEVALLFWTCAFGALIAYERRPTVVALIGIGLASIALALTRPAFILPLGAAAGAYYAMRRSYPALTAFAPIVAGLPAALLYFAYNAKAGGPSVLTQLHWQYTWQHATGGFAASHGPITWYLGALLMSGYQMVVAAVPELGGILLVVLAALGAQGYRENGGVRIAIFSIAVISVVVLVNPLGVERPLLLPMAPVIALLAVVALEKIRIGGPKVREE